MENKNNKRKLISIDKKSSNKIDYTSTTVIKSKNELSKITRIQEFIKHKLRGTNNNVKRIF